MTDQASALLPRETQEFKAYHSFLAQTRLFMETRVFESVHNAYRSEAAALGERAPRSIEEALGLLDRRSEFHLYAWMFRNLQRFKYTRSELSIVPYVRAQQDSIAPAIEAATRQADNALRLDPGIEMPAYFSMVDFHQHPGGIWNHELDGAVYDVARRTTTASHSDGNAIYRLIFNELPKDRRYARVLDLGCGHGAGLLTWLEAHPDSECHGVDLSAPCLKYAYARAAEAGRQVFLSQQDIEHLDYPDDQFDLVFFVFLLHEIPPDNMAPIFNEVRRILKPGGIMAGMEIALAPDDPFQNAIQISDGWLNNEPYLRSCVHTDFHALSARIGFSRVGIEPFKALIDSIQPAGPGVSPKMTWNMFTLEK